MTEVSTDQLKQAVEFEHGGTATFVQSVPIREMHGEQLVWEGTVHVFDLAHHPDGAFRAYAWSHEVEGGKRRFFAVLHGGPITGPREAVRAAIVAETRACRSCGGTGVVTEMHTVERFQKKPAPHECPKCNGTGRSK